MHVPFLELGCIPLKARLVAKRSCGSNHMASADTHENYLPKKRIVCFQCLDSYLTLFVLF